MRIGRTTWNCRFFRPRKDCGLIRVQLPCFGVPPSLRFGISAAPAPIWLAAFPPIPSDGFEKNRLDQLRLFGGDHPIAQDPDPFDLDLHPIAGLKKNGRTAGDTHACGRAGEE